MNEAPRPTGAAPVTLELTGCLMPWGGELPVLLVMPGSDDKYLPCFTTAEKLRATMKAAGITFASIKRIDDERDFLASVAGVVTVILDPWFTPEGRVRFLQVQP